MISMDFVDFKFGSSETPFSQNFTLHSNVTYRKSKLKCDEVPMLIHQHTASQDQMLFNKMTIMINGTKNAVSYYCNLRDRSLVDARRCLNFYNLN